MQKEFDLKKALAPFFVPAALPLIVELVDSYGVHIRISKQRNSKLGDYRAPHPQISQFHCISMNENLNPHAFLITFIHEWAHLEVYKKYGNQVQAHGEEWKQMFAFLMQDFMNEHIFPPDVLHALQGYFKHTYAATMRDLHLQRVLDSYGSRTDYSGQKNPLSKDMETGLSEAFVEQIKENAYFVYQNKVFLRKEKLRKNYLCIDKASGAKYRFHPLAKVWAL
ncbi:MAG: SprT-like domain-containing protein [Bacteroidales bacterium]